MAYHYTGHAEQVAYLKMVGSERTREDGSVIGCDNCLPGLVCGSHRWWDNGDEQGYTGL